MRAKSVTRLIGTCLALLMAVVLVFSMACDGNGGNGGTPTPGSTGIVGTIKIGGPCPLTGGYAAGGNELRFGYEQAVRDINARGGVNVAGQMYRLAITVLDDESDPTKTVSRMEALASQGVVVYTGSYSSETNAPAAGIAEKNRIPILAGSFSSLSPHLQGYQYLFSPFVKSPSTAKPWFDPMDESEWSITTERRIQVAQVRSIWRRVQLLGQEGRTSEKTHEPVPAGPSVSGQGCLKARQGIRRVGDTHCAGQG